MDSDTCRELFSTQPVARLGTVGAHGPHLVPIVFAIAGHEIVSAVDHKPKRSVHLQRLANITANPSVSVLTDHYSDDWTQLWWVRADGQAAILETGADHAAAIDLLVNKYDQYRFRRPDGPVVSISVTAWSGWRASPPVGSG